MLNGSKVYLNISNNVCEKKMSKHFSIFIQHNWYIYLQIKQHILHLKMEKKQNYSALYLEKYIKGKGIILNFIVF